MTNNFQNLSDVELEKLVNEDDAAALSEQARRYQIAGEHKKARDFFVLSSVLGNTFGEIELAKILQSENKLAEAYELYARAYHKGEDSVIPSIAGILMKDDPTLGIEVLTQHAFDGHLGCIRELVKIYRSEPDNEQYKKELTFWKQRIEKMEKSAAELLEQKKGKKAAKKTGKASEAESDSNEPQVIEQEVAELDNEPVKQVADKEPAVESPPPAPAAQEVDVDAAIAQVEALVGSARPTASFDSHQDSEPASPVGEAKPDKVAADAPALNENVLKLIAKAGTSSAKKETPTFNENVLKLISKANKPNESAPALNENVMKLISKIGSTKTDTPAFNENVLKLITQAKISDADAPAFSENVLKLIAKAKTQDKSGPTTPKKMRATATIKKPATKKGTGKSSKK